VGDHRSRAQLFQGRAWQIILAFLTGGNTITPPGVVRDLVLVALSGLIFCRGRCAAVCGWGHDVESQCIPRRASASDSAPRQRTWRLPNLPEVMKTKRYGTTR